jgi:1-acyl-sn-glycerol-3-phosphate acyltransferase
MLTFLPPFARGIVAALLLAGNTLLWCSLLFVFALLKLALPLPAVRVRVDRVLNGIATRWIACNSAWMRLTQPLDWDVSGVDALDPHGWYLVSCNHQSWADILVLQHELNRRIPLLKFFLKRELIFVPVIGLAWWALDFPFMRRHSAAYLLKHPEKRKDDLEATRRACAKFSLIPTSVMNFVEGTRFTARKHEAQRSPYRHLLRPRAGALALTLDAMGERFHSLLDVTIVYPEGAPTFWQFLCGRTRTVIVRVEHREVPVELRGGDYAADAQQRKATQRWLDALWQAKDAAIDAELAGAAATFSPRLRSPGSRAARC